MASIFKKKKSEAEKEGSSGAGEMTRKEEEDIAKAIELSLKPATSPKERQEEEDLAKAIQLSLKETTGTKGLSSQASKSYDASSLYPRFNNTLSALSLNDDHTSTPSQIQPTKEAYKVRALYDFEAAEDNELTFKSKEIILVLDDSDPNWWKGSNHRGEGLFPASFVTKDLDEPESVFKSSKKSVQFDEDIKVKVVERDTLPVVIDAAKIDKLLNLLYEADPACTKPDSDELLQLEDQCMQMNVLIDMELEKIDKTHAALTSVNQTLTEALNLYYSQMELNWV